MEGIQRQSLGASNRNNRAHIYTKVQALGSPVAGTAVKESACKEGAARDRVPSLGREDPLEEGMVTHPSVSAWRIPLTEGCPESQRVRHD